MKRKKGNEWMPPQVTIKKGRYVLQNYLGCVDGKPKYGKELVLGKTGETPKSKVWELYEDFKGITDSLTLQKLLDKYLASPQFKSLTTRTKKDYNNYYNIIVDLKLKKGFFGGVFVENITAGVIRKYLDKRTELGAPQAANKEVGFISSAFSWGYQRDLVKKNPCIGVTRNAKIKRQHYVEDKDYNRALEIASPSYVPLFMELAYLCRLRKNEVLSLTRANIKPEGLLVDRGKGSKGSLILWSDRLQSVIDECLKLPLKVQPINSSEIPLIHKNGYKITIGAIDSAWKRLGKKLKEEGLQTFWMHDLKRKSVSDFKGDKLKASGHRDPKMLEIYDVKVEEVESTR